LKNNQKLKIILYFKLKKKLILLLKYSLIIQKSCRMSIIFLRKSIV